MAILETEPHWLDRLTRDRRGKVSQPQRQIICDQCGLEGLNGQLHPTLYALNPQKTKKGTRQPTIYACEVHAVLMRHRPISPDFSRAMRHAKEAATHEKA